MPKWIFLFIGIAFQINCRAQIANYISNGSFEESYNCSYPFTLMKAKSWLSIDSISFAGIYRSTCNSYVPANAGGFQYPKTGNAFIGSTFFWDNNGRGYLKNRLKQSLQSGTTYCVKFYINITNSSTYGMDGFGIYFGNNTMDTITKCTIPLSYINPQVQNPSANIITDTLNWVPITGTFVANGTEKYALIGNFRSDAATNTVLINPTNLPLVFTDVCIDDVSCIDVDLPAHAGNDTSCIPGSSVYIGRQRDVGIDEACVWYQLPNMNVAIDTAAGIWVSPVVTTTYVVRQEICGNLKWDTVVVYQNPVGLESLEGLKVKSFEVYPIPADEVLNVKLEMLNNPGDETFEMLIYNSLGQVVREEEISFKEKSVKINTNAFSEGVYNLQLKSGGSQTASKRFVISR